MTSYCHQNLSGASVYKYLQNDQRIFYKFNRSFKNLKNVIFHVKLVSPTLKNCWIEGVVLNSSTLKIMPLFWHISPPKIGASACLGSSRLILMKGLGVGDFVEIKQFFEIFYLYVIRYSFKD